MDLENFTNKIIYYLSIKFGDDIFMKKILMMILLVTSCFSYGNDRLNRWIKQKNSETPILGAEKLNAIGMSEVLFYAKEKSPELKVMLGFLRPTLGAEVLSVGFFSDNYLENSPKIDLSFICKVDNNKELKFNGHSEGGYREEDCVMIFAYESEEEVFRELINQMRNGEKIEIAVKIDGRNENFEFPLEGFRKLYKDKID